MVCTLLAGVNVVAFAADDELSDSTPVFCAYNKNNGEHFFTANEAEYNNLVSIGWDGEGQKWSAPLYSDSPIYRLYNQNSGEHYFTLSEAEAAMLASVGWNDEGVGMYSDDDMGTPIYCMYNPNATGQFEAGAHHYTKNEAEAASLESIGWVWTNDRQAAFYGVEEEEPVGGEVTLSTTSPKVGDTIKANVNLVGTDTVEGYQWTLNGAEIEGATNSSYTVPDTANRGDLISVVVYTSAGQILEPTTKATVSIAAATLIDEDGLQEDGTAVVGDNLRITYTSDLGNPQNVTWYRDGTAVKTSTAANFDFTMTTTKAGNYYATVTAADGTVYTSNTITCSDKELPAVLTDFAITEDTSYGVTATKGAEKIDYAAETDNLIATVTMNKLYAGDFYVVKASSKDYAKDKITLTDKSAKTNFTLETNVNAFTDLNALTNYYETNLNKGLMYKNTDGSVTFKIVLDGGSDLKRGESYMLLFHQTAIPASNPGKGDEIMTLPDEAPYLEAPASVVVSKAQVGSGVELEFRDADGNKLDWFGAQGAAAATDVGITSAIMYKASENVAGSGTNLNNTTKNVEKGTLTGTGNGDAGFQYYSAVVTFKKGIYSKEQLTLTTEAKALATQSLNAMALYNNKVNPTTATVKFNNLVTDGMVGILHTESGGIKKPAGQQYKEDLKAVQNGDLSKLTGMAVVSKGTSKVDIEGAITSVNEDADGMDIYVPVFLPNDTEGYTTVYAEDGDFAKHLNQAMMDIPDTIQADAFGKVWLLVNSQKETAYSMTGSVSNLAVTTGAAVQITLNGGTVKAGDAANGDTNLVKVYDQYGDEFETETTGDYKTALSGLTFDLKKTSSVKTAATSVTLQIANIGKTGTKTKYTGLVLTVNDDAKNSTWEAITPAGQVITVKFNSTGLVTITIE